MAKSFLVGSLAVAPYLTKADVYIDVRDSVQPLPLPAAKWERGKTHRAYVCADNQESVNVASANWNVGIDQVGINPNGVYGRPIPSMDFFANQNINNVPGYMPFNQYSGANTLEGGASPGTSKALEYWDFAVDSNTPLGPFNFVFNAASFGDTQFNDLNPALNPNPQQFRIMPLKADIDANAIVDTNDIQSFVDVLLGNETRTAYIENSDWSGNDDGQVDGRDIKGFLENYLANGQ